MIHLIHLKNVPIIEQLQIEEALLRTSDKNFLLVNEGSPKAIVMGISGKKEELVHPSAAHIPLIRRFSGGGTVIVDEETLFISFLMNKNTHDFAPFPEPILRWTGDIYKQLIPGFTIHENDYAIGDKKIGGNAQYIRKNRWLHHTTFLWDYDPENMNYLLHPKRTPTYRQDRSHTDFITPLKPHVRSKEWFLRALFEHFNETHGLADAKNYRDALSLAHRKTTTLVS